MGLLLVKTAHVSKTRSRKITPKRAVTSQENMLLSLAIIRRSPPGTPENRDIVTAETTFRDRGGSVRKRCSCCLSCDSALLGPKARYEGQIPRFWRQTGEISASAEAKEKAGIVFE